MQTAVQTGDTFEAKKEAIQKLKSLLEKTYHIAEVQVGAGAGGGAWRVVVFQQCAPLLEGRAGGTDREGGGGQARRVLKEEDCWCPHRDCHRSERALQQALGSSGSRRMLRCGL